MLREVEKGKTEVICPSMAVAGGGFLGKVGSDEKGNVTEWEELYKRKGKNSHMVEAGGIMVLDCVTMERNR